MARAEIEDDRGLWDDGVVLAHYPSPIEVKEVVVVGQTTLREDNGGVLSIGPSSGHLMRVGGQVTLRIRVDWNEALGFALRLKATRQLCDGLPCVEGMIQFRGASKRHLGTLLTDRLRVTVRVIIEDFSIPVIIKIKGNWRNYRNRHRYKLNF